MSDAYSHLVGELVRFKDEYCLHHGMTEYKGLVFHIDCVEDIETHTRKRYAVSRDKSVVEVHHKVTGYDTLEVRVPVEQLELADIRSNLHIMNADE